MYTSENIHNKLLRIALIKSNLITEGGYIIL